LSSIFFINAEKRTGNKSKILPWRKGKFNSGIKYDRSYYEIWEALFSSAIAWNPSNY
jgi:hypothetical protein